jgi:hypothetical protein
VRRQVQREAKRVAELAAAAVLAAAASPDDKDDSDDKDDAGDKPDAGGPVGAHAATEPTGQHAAKVSASAKVTVPPATRVGADAD